MNHKPKTNEDQQLINKIHVETKKRGWTLRDTAEELGISHIYLTSITCGARKVSGLSFAKQRMMAQFLGISIIDFFLQCGVLRQEDFGQN